MALMTFVVVMGWVAFGSVAYDVYTYGHRQDRWEKLHPGATYIRNYRSLEKKGLHSI